LTNRCACRRATHRTFSATKLATASFAPDTWRNLAKPLDVILLLMRSLLVIVFISLVGCATQPEIYSLESGAIVHFVKSPGSTCVHLGMSPEGTVKGPATSFADIAAREELFDEKSKVVLKSDPEIPFDDLLEVMDAARQAGITTVSVLSGKCE